MGKMVVIIAAAYIIVYLPIIILTSIDPNATITQHEWMVVAHIFLCSLVVIDPLVYICYQEKYLKEIKVMIGVLFAKKKEVVKRKEPDSEATVTTIQSA